jgi:WhiB family transcriptional regulator, redox-sensing transcriptional regulator
MTANPYWRDNAACRNVPNPEVFFPRPSETADEAKKICARCPVRVECLKDAFDQGDVYGFRGGMAGEARRKALVGRGRRPSQDEEIRRLSGLGWSAEAVCTALGVSRHVVYRANSRRSGEAA